MKTPSYTFTDLLGTPLLTNGRRVSFETGNKKAVAFGSRKEVLQSKALWEKQTGRDLIGIPAGEVEHMSL